MLLKVFAQLISLTTNTIATTRQESFAQ